MNEITCPLSLEAKKSLAYLKTTAIALLLSVSCFAQNKSEGISVLLPENATRQQVLEASVKVCPSYRQLDYQEREMLGFIHIGMNTFTGAEWGTGKEDPSIFNPTLFNGEELVKIFKDAGLTGVILVAKHHDGFCVWPSRYTTHNISHSPWKDGKGDLVKEVSDACRKYKMKFCLYLSPWDMHEKTYGTDAYNDYYIHQLEELLTHYGPVYLLWFDGAGTVESVSGKKMPFDWQRIFGKARELQPDVLLSGNAPDIRWVGNEIGKGRSTEWCVQGINNKEVFFGSLDGYSYKTPNLGSIEDLMTKKRLVWYPSRGGLPIRKGWFYNAKDDNNIKSLRYLVDSYFSTVGQNSNLLPNLSPDKSGRVPQKDSNRLIQFGRIIKKMKSIDYAKQAQVVPISGWVGRPSSSLITDGSPYTSWHTADGTTSAIAEVRLKRPATINVIKLQENVRDFGQRVDSFAIDVKDGSSWRKVAEGTTIGYRRMLRLSQPVHASSFRIRILHSRISVSLSNLSLYYLENVPEDDSILNEGRNVIDYRHIAISTQQLQNVKNLSELLHNNSNSMFSAQVKTFPASIVFAADGIVTFSGLSYLPDDKNNAHIDNYAIYLSMDGEKWGKAILVNRFGNIENNPVEQVVSITPTKAKYLRLEIQKVTSTNGEISIKQIKLYH